MIALALAILLWAVPAQTRARKPADECVQRPGGVLHTFRGRVKSDESFSRLVGPYRVELRPEGRWGWVVGVRPAREDRDLTSMIPLHGRSGREIQPEDVTGRPWLWRYFYFHPQMRKTIVYHDDAKTMLADDQRVRTYGQGRLTIERYAMGKDDRGQPRFEWLEFRGCVSWPAR